MRARSSVPAFGQFLVGLGCGLSSSRDAPRVAFLHTRAATPKPSKAPFLLLFAVGTDLAPPSSRGGQCHSEEF